MWDTTREREIKIGRTYKSDPLPYGQCLINEKWRDILGLDVGEIAYFDVQMPNLINAFIRRYNFEKNGNITEIRSRHRVRLPCKVNAMISNP